ncbi:MAG: hypothetical protein MI741_12210, partial [Rhodospirillales bacterium]|nr:hypothetical protein [Rhodospirillales bacterium]
IVSTAQSVTNSVDRQVFYDHNHNYYYENDAGRGSYDYDAFINNIDSQFDSREAFQKHRLPFGRLEAVAGIRVINVEEGYDFANPQNSDPDSYVDLFFSRYTGAPIRIQP